MTLDLLRERGTPLEKQEFDWKQLAGHPTSKLDDDAFTRVRIILMNGIEAESLRLGHMAARFNPELQRPLARIRRVDHHQQTLVNWLLPADLHPLETTIGFEQVAIELTASIAEHEPDPYLAQVHRFGLLEDFDHLYRYSALMDRVMGKDANSILQCYTDICPGRPTAVEHRHPHDDLRRPYDKTTAHPLSKLHAMTLTGAETQTHDYYMTIGPQFADPVARQLYAEIASIEEQHVTQYESLMDPSETWLEKLMMMQACEAYNYYSCLEYETNPRVRLIWEQMLSYELGHLAVMRELFEKMESRDSASVLPATLPAPIEWDSHREFVRQVLQQEVHLRAVGTEIVDPRQTPESEETLAYRKRLNSSGSPSEIVAAGWTWNPGTELATKVAKQDGKQDGKNERASEALS